MASPPEPDLFRDDGQFCGPCLNDCNGDQSANVLLAVQGTTRQGDRTEMKEIEEPLAEGLSKLSFKERSEALDDIHCRGEELNETSELLEQSLAKFDQIVQSSNNPIYNKAWSQNRSYLEDPSFRLKFLTANELNARKAVNQMFFFLGQKGMYFGEEKVAHDILPEDMSSKEKRLMKSSPFQILKDRDRRGRVVLYVSSHRISESAEWTVESMVHIMYQIIFNMVISIPSVQTKGVVLIFYDESKGDLRLPGLTFRMKVDHFFNSLPLWISSLHLCFHSSPKSLNVYNNLFQFSLKTLADHVLPRTRIHCGSDMERQYKLRGFGIALENFPVDLNGIIRRTILKAWQKKCLGSAEDCPVIAAHQPPQGQLIIIKPKATDVLFLGHKRSNNPGNNRLLRFIKDMFPTYESASKEEKRSIVNQIVDDIHQTGGRFLNKLTTSQEEGELWEELPLEKVRSKVIQSFRNYRHRQLAVSKKATDGTLIVGEPLHNDVVFGKTRPTTVGSALLHELILLHAEEYATLGHGMKSEAANSVMGGIVAKGGRFLQRDDGRGGWLELSDELVRARISKYFQNYRRPSKKSSTDETT